MGGADVDIVVESIKCMWDDLEMFEADPRMPPLMFNHEVYEDRRPLMIGIYYDLPDTVPIVPSVKRALNMTKKALEAQGHTIVPWTPPETDLAYKLWFAALYANEMQDSVHELKNDELDPCIQYMLGTLASTPRWLKKLKSFFLRFTDPRMAEL